MSDSLEDTVTGEPGGREGSKGTSPRSPKTGMASAILLVRATVQRKMGAQGATLVLPEQGAHDLVQLLIDKLSGRSRRSPSAPLSLHRGHECAWSGARRCIRNYLTIMAPISFSAFGSSGFRSATIFSINCPTRGLVSFS